MKKIIFIAFVVFFSVLFYSNVYSSCYAPAIAGSPDCIGENMNYNINKGESRTTTAYLKKGETYRAAATGCPRAGTIEISVIRNGSVIASESSYAPKLCFTAPEDGNYTFRAKLKTTTGRHTWGNVKACLYKTTRC